MKDDIPDLPGEFKIEPHGPDRVYVMNPGSDGWTEEYSDNLTFHEIAVKHFDQGWEPLGLDHISSTTKLQIMANIIFGGQNNKGVNANFGWELLEKKFSTYPDKERIVSDFLSMIVFAYCESTMKRREKEDEKNNRFNKLLKSIDDLTNQFHCDVEFRKLLPKTPMEKFPYIHSLLDVYTEKYDKNFLRPEYDWPHATDPHVKLDKKLEMSLELFGDAYNSTRLTYAGVLDKLKAEIVNLKDSAVTYKQPDAEFAPQHLFWLVLNDWLVTNTGKDNYEVIASFSYALFLKSVSSNTIGTTVGRLRKKYHISYHSELKTDKN